MGVLGYKRRGARRCATDRAAGIATGGGQGVLALARTRRLAGHTGRPGPDGWDSPDLARAWDGLLRGLTEQAGSPVLAAVIHHSEGAQLLGHSPVGGRWGGWLLADRIAWRSLPPDSPSQYWDEHGNRHTEDDAVYERRQQEALDRIYATAGPPGSQAASSVVAWAKEAGLDPDPAAAAATTPPPRSRSPTMAAASHPTNSAGSSNGKRKSTRTPTAATPMAPASAWPSPKPSCTPTTAPSPCTAPLVKEPASPSAYLSRRPTPPRPPLDQHQPRRRTGSDLGVMVDVRSQ
jgi:hypothetical protein